MATIAIKTEGKFVSTERSWLEKYMLRRFHPRSIFIQIVGLIWFTYYIWQQDWKAATGTFLILVILNTFAIANVDTEALAETVLGRLAALHLEPINMVVQLTGVCVFYYGIWQHSTEFILGGISLIFLGHIFGWARVDSHFADKFDS